MNWSVETFNEVWFETQNSWLKKVFERAVHKMEAILFMFQCVKRPKGQYLHDVEGHRCVIITSSLYISGPAEAWFEPVLAVLQGLPDPEC